MSDQVRNPEDRFSHNEAHMSLVMLGFRPDKTQTELLSYRNQLSHVARKTAFQGFRPGPTQTGLLRSAVAHR